MTADGAERSVEIERKYDADDAVSLPDWTRLPGVARVGEPEPRALDARYLDTADGALGRAATALRRRTGRPDEGWHVKSAGADGKHESRWPLDLAADEESPVVPDAVRQELAGILGASAALAVIARIRNDRTAYALTDAAGGLVAEFVDDRVTATDVRRGTTISWREWELELGPAAPLDAAAHDALFAAADALVVAAGGRVSASGSKLGRALGL